MDGQLFITQGDITRICADAVGVTSGVTFGRTSSNFERLSEYSEHSEGGEGDAFLTAFDSAQKARPHSAASYWVPLSDERAPHGVAFVSRDAPDAGWDGRPPGAMVREAIDTAVPRLRERAEARRSKGGAGDTATDEAVSDRFLIALIAFRMEQGGDREDRLVSARQQVRAAFEALDVYPDIDIAFLIDGDAKYEIFLDARRRELAEMKRERPPFDREELADLIDALKNGECVAFIGAGLSVNSRVMGYRALIQEMADELEIDDEIGNDPDVYLDVAQGYRNGKGSMDSLIRKHFGSDTRALPSLAHYLLLSLPVRLVLTTNYDRLLETTLEALKRYPLRVVDETQVARTGYRDGTYVVKFHGDAHDGHIIISRDDYDGFFRDRPEMAALLEGLLLNQTFLFVGYSLRDPNFRQVYSKIDRMLRQAKRPAFATMLDPVRAITRQQMASRQLRLIELAGEDKDAPRRLLYLLDRLGEEVTGKSRLFLAPDAQPGAGEAPGALGDLYKSLRRAGDSLAAAGSRTFSIDETRTAARVLETLCDLGWQPPAKYGVSLSGLWERLADNLLAQGGAVSPREVRQLLTWALRYARDDSSAAHLRTRLESLEKEVIPS